MRHAAIQLGSIPAAIMLCAMAVGSSAGHCAQAASPPAGDSASRSASRSASHSASLSVNEQIEMARRMNEANRQSTVAENLDVSAEAADAFWPVYREYRRAVNELNDELKNVVLRYAKNYRDLSGDEAYELAESTAKLQTRRDELKHAYLKRFGEVLSPLDAARVFQIENKLDALSMAMLAVEIPVAKAASQP